MVRLIVTEPPSSRRAVADPSAFGDKMIYLFAVGEQRPSLFDTDALSDLICDKLLKINYKPDEDIIVIGGGITINCHLCAVIGVAYGEFKVLLYDSNKGRYFEGKLG